MFLEKVLDDGQIGLIEDMACEIWHEYFTPIIGKAQVDYMLEKFQSKKAITEQIGNGFKYYLIKNNSGPVGYLAVLAKVDQLFLSKLYIVSAERGMGYARIAVEHLEKLAVAEGLRKISLTVNKDNVDTIKIYTKLGFKNMGSVVQEIGNGFIMDDYKMEKDIEIKSI